MSLSVFISILNIGRSIPLILRISIYSRNFEEVSEIPEFDDKDLIFLLKNNF